jgi:hypothetical protein
MSPPRLLTLSLAMPRQTVEERLAHLESRVSELQAELRAKNRPKKDWRRTIGAFTDDPGMQQILQEAMRLREADRAKARGKKTAKRKPRS